MRSLLDIGLAVVEAMLRGFMYSTKKDDGDFVLAPSLNRLLLAIGLFGISCLFCFSWASLDFPGTLMCELEVGVSLVFVLI